MKKTVIVQITLNIVFALITVLFILGKMVDVKYTFDDSISTSTYSISEELYSCIFRFSILIFLIILSNTICCIIIFKDIKRRN